MSVMRILCALSVCMHDHACQYTAVHWDYRLAVRAAGFDAAEAFRDKGDGHGPEEVGIQCESQGFVQPVLQRQGSS